ncbi:MAG: response regulator, partial [Syntrophales bacterium]|nr:response regulator [Syntrophales bacterium]
SNLLDHPGINGLVITSRDITVRKQAELEKDKLYKQLLHAQKMEAIGTLAGGLAHDFNNLLMGIQGYASLALHEMHTTSHGHERLQGIEAQVKKGADLTKQLLGFARGGKYEVKATQLNELIMNAAEMFGRTKKEISIEMNLQEDCWTVNIDQGQIDQTLLNIFINACQAMPGGGNLYLETCNIGLNEYEAALYGLTAGNYVRISITDTGTGMDDATRQRIFEPFFTTKPIGLGTGLGLASAYGIIKNHSGIIDVESTLGIGTTFRIYLPASTNVNSEESRSDERMMSGHETILLVDDEHVNLLILKELLEAIGYKVLIAGSGHEAIATYMSKRDQIDIVVMDMIMPGIGGSKTFEAIRDINPDAKVILCSGYSIEGEAETIMAKGCDGFIQKPFRIESLTRKIHEALAK